jgi:hypothetical protein
MYLLEVINWRTFSTLLVLSINTKLVCGKSYILGEIFYTILIYLGYKYIFSRYFSYWLVQSSSRKIGTSSSIVDSLPSVSTVAAGSFVRLVNYGRALRYITYCVPETPVSPIQSKVLANTIIAVRVSVNCRGIWENCYAICCLPRVELPSTHCTHAQEFWAFYSHVNNTGRSTEVQTQSQGKLNGHSFSCNLNHVCVGNDLC